MPQGRSQAPEAVVIVATVRALKMHGGVPKDELGEENVEALKKGLAEPGPPHRNVGKFGVPAVVGHQPLHQGHRGRAGQAIQDFTPDPARRRRGDL
jgi:formyltetrahydrofolate synthetase